ncbi:uncharacterized protein DUF4339 [Prosthecobacter fusiformis]|uniref:Uncharacterized protein DUF4339 n=1 Tax=Prosthecobacter fusiformis TaxID=48464 RepID=A0A4R7SRV9_9BACT|nr:GYF domain-containing protein [Prosthecobacter fusiformis]TDU81206.1 uncharacterized protein DUF4339 [Prosthecobacter fusiformis]
MHYSIAREGQHLGSFPEQALREGMTDGRFRYQDLAWTEGLAEWKPLGLLLGFAPPLPDTVFMPQHAQPKAMKDDAGMRLLLPVGRSAWAIAAGYLGLFSLLIIPAPVAVIISLIAIQDIRKSKLSSKGPKYGMGRAIFGLIMGLAGTVGIMFLVYALLNQPRY